MGLLSGILMAPFAPIKGTVWVAEKSKTKLNASTMIPVRFVVNLKKLRKRVGMASSRMRKLLRWKKSWSNGS